MSAPLIAVVTILYLGVAISLYLEGRTGMSLCFLGYCLANIGIIIDVAK